MEQYKEIEEKHQKLINIAIEKMKTSTDIKHDCVHVFGVVKYVKEILDYVPEADKEVCIVSAYWHDVGRLIQAKGHAKISADLIKEQMKELNYDEEFIEKCYKAIVNHNYDTMPETIEGIILRDADKIDCVDSKKWAMCIDQNCKFNKTLELLPVLREEIFQLECSKKIFDREMVKLVMVLHNKIFNI